MQWTTHKHVYSFIPIFMEFGQLDIQNKKKGHPSIFSSPNSIHYP